MRTFQGTPASEGLAVGAMRLLRHTPQGAGRAVQEPAQEERNYRAAVRDAVVQLERMEKKNTGADRDILMAQRAILEDQGLQDEVLGYIRAGAGAAASVERAAGIYAGRIRALEDDYMRERACDILDACYRVVDVLDDQPRQVLQLDSPAVIAADELYPTDILTLDRSMILGLVTAEGSPNAHASIIARTMGIPAVVMAGRDFLEECDGRPVAVDGFTGEVFVDPDEATKARFAHSIRLRRRQTLSGLALRSVPCKTRDGVRVSLYANCADSRDVRAAVEAGAEGVGLLSSEVLLLAGTGAGEAEQVAFFSECLAAAAGKPVTISVYDIGADKVAPGLPQNEEPNPALGQVGIRFCLAHPGLFRTHLCALLRAGTAGNLRIVLPMVNNRRELDAVRAAVADARADLRARRLPYAQDVPIGVMVDTPAAALMAEELAADASFFTVNPANLAQYAHGVDRSNAHVQQYFPHVSAPVHKLLRMVVDAARPGNIPVCVCCANADSLAQAETYVRMGVRALSMPTVNLLPMKETLMSMSLHSGQPAEGLRAPG